MGLFSTPESFAYQKIKPSKGKKLEVIPNFIYPVCSFLTATFLRIHLQGYFAECWMAVESMPNDCEWIKVSLPSITVILLWIVIVSPGTHLVKNHGSLSITSASQLRKKKQNKNIRSPNLKMLGPLCYQTVNLGKDGKIIYYRLLKLK